MSGEFNDHLGAGSEFAPTYPMPQDVREMRDKITAEAGQASGREGDIDVPLFNEAIGHLENCLEDPRIKLSMFLRRVPVTPELVAQYESAAEWQGSATRQQIVDADKIPVDTTWLLGRLYGLTGASAVRDDLQDAYSKGIVTRAKGVVIRQGQYDDKPVYFRETYGVLPEESVYNTYYDDNEQRSLGVEVMGEAAGQVAMVELNQLQREHLAAFIGKDEALVRSTPHYNTLELKIPPINTQNFSEILSAFSSARALAGKLALQQAETEYMAGHRSLRLLAYFGLYDGPRFNR